MFESAIASISNQLFSSPFSMFIAQIVAFIVPSIAVIALSDWYSRDKAAEWESSIRDLKALFALEDPRPPQHRARRTPRA
jgi:purine-cytosine permease-like protein